MDDLLVCSHRGPYTYEDVGGRLEGRYGGGGLVTALSALTRGGEGVRWLACSLTDLDREVANGRPAAVGAGVRPHLLDLPRETHRAFYDDACVTGLGFLLHGLVDQAYSPDFGSRFQRGWAAYREVNRAYGEAVARLAEGRAVLVEDYHLMLVADAVRRAGAVPAGPMVYFHHVPWCSPAYFTMLPRRLREEILGKLLAFDSLGFQARRWAEEFLACCAAFLPGARCEPDRVAWRGREIPIVVAPVQLDMPHVREMVSSPEAESWRRRLSRLAGGRRTIVRVDRVDLWKNIVRGFQSFERLVLDEKADDVVFVALLARSRTHLPEYRRYLAACELEAERINRRLNPGGAGPIHVLLAEHGGDRQRAMAGLCLADAVLVNSTSDGLNLVAKESVAASRGRSRLVLSETTGVYEEIGRWVRGVNPFDIDDTAAALAAALRENGEVTGLRAAVERDSPAAWVRRRLAPVC